MLDSYLCWENRTVEMKEEEKGITYWERSTGKDFGIAGKQAFEIRKLRAAKVRKHKRFLGWYPSGIYRPLKKFKIWFGREKSKTSNHPMAPRGG